MKKTIVISAVNLIEGGTLIILRNALSELSQYFSNNYHIVALVHKKKLADYPNIEYREFTWVKRSWLWRVYFEYVYCRFLSKKLNAYLWLSLHDMTPNVTALLQVVYCHNSTPFYNPKFSSIRYNYKEFLFSRFYKYLYRINIHKNDIVIVQQNWLKEAFKELYRLDDAKIIVAKPFENESDKKEKILANSSSGTPLFFYPSLPRTFKNFEVICEATALIVASGTTNFSVVLTINGSENRYTQNIVNAYCHIKQIKFVGLLSKDKVIEIYSETSCLIFASKLETWGLPISEFIPSGKPMIISDLPYAHETAMGAKQVAFFNPESAEELSQRMREVLNNDKKMFIEVTKEKESENVVHSWGALFHKLLRE